MISIIIVNYNGKEYTRAFLESLRAVSPAVKHEIIVVDNCSTDGSREIIQSEFPEVLLIQQDRNEGFGKANNVGARIAKGDYLFFINNDTLFTHDILKPLLLFMETDKTIGIAAPMLLHQDGTFQLSYGNYPSFINELRMKRDATLIREIPRTRSPKQVEWVSFAAVMVRKSAYESIHGFDERYFLYFEDADFCYRMQQNGYKTFYCAEYSLIHTRGGSWSDAVVHGIKIEYRRSQIIFYQSHRSMYESIALRIFLVCRCMVLFLVNSGEYRTRALSTMKLALFYHANRS